ncbi:MAG: hypothetical protein E7379_01825 [Clostridiales bacterium]|nr:hypothetical protein [Clostridiales bacterium]
MKLEKFIIFLILPCICLLTFLPVTTNNTTFASTNEIIEEDIGDKIDNQIEDLDFSYLDEILAQFNSNQTSIFGGRSFAERLKLLISGEFASGQGLLQSIVAIFFDGIVNLLPTLSIIIAISILGNMIQGIKPSGNSKSLTNIIHFVVYGVVVILVLGIIVQMITLASTALRSMQNQMNGVFPLLLTMLTAIGGTASVSVYQPAMALLANGILNLFSYILLPLFIFSVIFSIVSNLSNTIKLDKFASFCNSSFKWIVGLIFTIFTAFISLQGITAGSFDGISLRTAKYAIRSYVPILGGYLSDGMSLIMVSSNIIKNGVGATGLIMMLASILSPILEMVIFMLALKFIAGVIEPLGNKQIANFISSLSKSMVLLIVILIGVAFVYFILIGLVICSANIV